MKTEVILSVRLSDKINQNAPFEFYNFKNFMGAHSLINCQKYMNNCMKTGVILSIRLSDKINQNAPFEFYNFENFLGAHRAPRPPPETLL